MMSSWIFGSAFWADLKSVEQGSQQEQHELLHPFKDVTETQCDTAQTSVRGAMQCLVLVAGAVSPGEMQPRLYEVA
jgi:hypothetical protein